ncbi:hypothetical protein BU23DRAFT_649247 [Bimuria novae-zelandiae CBS 107.79]|uniref:Uncharacterized protein n=1 Tax=Bimuria novae-zelandiae CBS 107.79 TaxID=1447943 RepID=A0A6A5V3J7_9PLEO|nr:hypothetical protein BU23DRAFT_649247 [Bimuria novae-zelandiae CBS 107.79]
MAIRTIIFHFSIPTIRRIPDLLTMEYARYRRSLALRSGQQPLPAILEIAIAGNREEVLRQDHTVEFVRVNELSENDRDLISFMRTFYHRDRESTGEEGPLMVVRVARSSFIHISAADGEEFEEEMNEYAERDHWEVDGRVFQGTVVGRAVDEDEYVENWCSGEFWNEDAVANGAARRIVEGCKADAAKTNLGPIAEEV